VSYLSQQNKKRSKSPIETGRGRTGYDRIFLTKCVMMTKLIKYMFLFIIAVVVINTGTVLSFSRINYDDPYFVPKAHALNFAISSTGLVAGFPEIAANNFRFASGAGEDITVSGDFLLESEKVRNAVSHLLTEEAGSSKYLTWTHNEMWHDSPRVTFAVNPITITKVFISDECSVFHGSVKMEYVTDHKTTIVPGLIVVDEGIYREMQRRGHYKSFVTNYEFDICNKDVSSRTIPWIDDALQLAYTGL
jgi:hypothetical protein